MKKEGLILLFFICGGIVDKVCNLKLNQGALLWTY